MVGAGSRQEGCKPGWLPIVAGLLAILAGGAWWWRQAGLMP